MSNNKYKPPMDRPMKDIWRKNKYEIDYSYVIKDGKTHPVAILCPGGGYYMVCSFVEGRPLAQYLNSKGISAVIIYYRTKKLATFPNPMDDLAKGVKEVMLRAKELKLDFDNYSLWGASAGGHLAASFGTESLGYEKYFIQKPKTLVLMYPVISMDPAITHQGSMENLIGKNPSQEMIDKTSINKLVTYKYPRTFIWCGDADKTVSPKNSELMVEALEKENIPYMYKLYPGVDHGVGLASGIAAEGWIDDAIDYWLNGK